MKQLALYVILFLCSFQHLSAQEKGAEPQVQYTAIDNYKYTKHTNLEGEVPQIGEYVYFHAQIRKRDTVMFASRENKSAPFIQITETKNRNINPAEALIRELVVGDSATLEVRIDTLPQVPKGFEGERILYYDVVILEIIDEAAYEEKLAAEKAIQDKEIEALKERREEVASLTQTYLSAYNTNSLGNLETTSSGLKYLLLEEGNGPQSEAGKEVTAHYYGLLTDGSSFDDSFQRGVPFSVPIGQGMVIPGWEEGLTLFKEGARFILFIPPNLGYGEAGVPPAIPGNSELVFYIELIGVE